MSSSTITIRSRLDRATGHWVPEPGSPKWNRDKERARKRAEKAAASNTR